MNEARLRQSIVRVRADGTGTGFVVGPGLILTCDHVVSGLTDITVEVGSVSVPVDQVTRSPTRTGRPVCDLALLRARLPPLPEVELDPAGPEPGDALYAFGFTDQYPQGDSALFVFEGPSIEREEHLYRLKNAQARPGLSGAPLLSLRTTKVVGVVNRTRDRETDLGARAVPIESALRLWPELAARVTRDAPEPDRVDADTAHLERLIAIHERNVQLLETQIAKYGALDVPLHKQNELEDQRAELARLRSLLSRGGEDNDLERR